MRIWKVHSAFRPESPSVSVDADASLTGDLSRVAKVREVDFHSRLEPASGLSAATVITRVRPGRRVST
jgi:hypothetical protein